MGQYQYCIFLVYIISTSCFDIILVISNQNCFKQNLASISATDRLAGEFDSTSPTSRSAEQRGMRLFPIGGGFNLGHLEGEQPQPRCFFRGLTNHGYLGGGFTLPETNIAPVFSGGLRYILASTFNCSNVRPYLGMMIQV